MTTTTETGATLRLIVRHCGDTYKACCLEYPTVVFPNGWCNCNCGDCRVAKYQALEDANGKESQ